MDRITIAQIDRIETKQEEIEAKIDKIIQYLEEEEIIEEEKQLKEIEEGEEYKNKPFA